MPDHVHILLRGDLPGSDLPAFVFAWKQSSGYRYRRAYAQRLWQVGYFERVLRDEEDTETLVKYILGNPVRKGLTSALGDYPYAWSAWGPR
jgi:putative transposase